MLGTYKTGGSGRRWPRGGVGDGGEGVSKEGVVWKDDEIAQPRHNSARDILRCISHQHSSMSIFRLQPSTHHPRIRPTL
jgi:hypothetical protein